MSVESLQKGIYTLPAHPYRSHMGPIRAKSPDRYGISISDPSRFCPAGLYGSHLGCRHSTEIPPGSSRHSAGIIHPRLTEIHPISNRDHSSIPPHQTDIHPRYCRFTRYTQHLADIPPRCYQYSPDSTVIPPRSYRCSPDLTNIPPRSYQYSPDTTDIPPRSYR